MAALDPEEGDALDGHLARGVPPDEAALREEVVHLAGGLGEGPPVDDGGLDPEPPEEVGAARGEPVDGGASK